MSINGELETETTNEGGDDPFLYWTLVFAGIFFLGIGLAAIGIAIWQSLN